MSMKTLPSKTLLSLLVLVLAIHGIGLAQNPVPMSEMQKERIAQMAGAKDGPFVSYEYDSQDVWLRQNLRKVAVELSDYNQGVALRANRALRGLSSVRTLATPRSDYVRSRFVMEWSQGDVPTSVTWQARAAALRGSSGVKAVWPVYIYPPTGIDVYCPGEVALKINGDYTTQTISKIAGKEGLYLVNPVPQATGVVVLRQKDPTVSDPFTLAKKLAALKDAVVWASPNLTQSYKLYSNWAPWTGISPQQFFSGPQDPLYPQQWHLPRAHFDDLYNTLKNRGDWPLLFGMSYNPYGYYHNTRIPVVAIVDTGIDYTHEDIWPNTYRNWSEYQDETNPYDGMDNDFNQFVDDLIGWDFLENDNTPWSAAPHGTACAGIACGRGYNGIGIRGGNPVLAVMAVKIADENGFAPDADIARALIYAGMMADVASNSWGGGAPSDAIHEAILHCLTFGRLGYRVNEYSIYTPMLRGSGTPVFFASHNYSQNEPTFPGSDPWAVTVGATDPNDKRFYYSNSGAGVDITAPAGAVTTDITGPPGYDPGNYTSTFGGTSSATPLAASTALTALAYNIRNISEDYVYWHPNTYNRFIQPPNAIAAASYDHANYWTDPRFYTAGEIIQAVIHGTDKVSSAHANYDKFGHSLQYGWGRIHAKKIFDLLPTEPDDVWQETWGDRRDPSTISAKYLRPGFHKWLIARDPDYFLLSMEAGSSAKITVTYLRHAYFTPNDLLPAVQKIWGKYTDESTSPRLAVSIWPELDPYDPARHTKQFNPDGTEIHPLNTILTNTNDHHRLEDKIETRIYYESRKTLKADYSTDWDRSVPDRPFRDQDVAYYLIVKPLPEYMRRMNNLSTKTYSPIIDYNVNFEYCPAPKPHRVFSYPNPMGGTYYVHYYGDDYDGNFQWGNYRVYEDNLPGGAFPILRSDTTLKSVTYSPEEQYMYPALTEETHVTDFGRGPATFYRFPVDYRRRFNCLVAYEPRVPNILIFAWDDFGNIVDTSQYAGAPAQALWDIKPTRKDTYDLGLCTFQKAKPNQYFTDIHYSLVDITATSTPIEFTTPSSGNLDLDYYPYEHLTLAKGYQKVYTLKTANYEGARVSVAQKLPGDYTVWLKIFDNAGLAYALAESYYNTQSVILGAQDKATSYSILAYLVSTPTRQTTSTVPPADFRYQIAVGRYKIPPELPRALPLPGLPDVTVKSYTLNVDPDLVWADQAVQLNTLVVKNQGTDMMSTFTMVIYDEDRLTTITGIVPQGDLPAGATKTFSDVALATYPPGERVINIALDPENKVQELDESNNLTTFSLKVFAFGPDLAMLNTYTVSPSNPCDTTRVRLTFSVTNQGPVDMSDPFSVVIRDGAGKQLAAIPYVPPLASGQSMTTPFPISIGFLPSGTNNIHVIVVGSSSDDVNPANDELVIPITVRESGAEHWNQYR